jgi:hypothetical protein
MSLPIDPAQLHVAYAVYLAVSIALTVWVARTLSSSGEVFLVRCFGQDIELAHSTNRLLVIGFYLINLGFISYRLGRWPETGALVPEIGMRIGVTLLVLGAMHFFNMLLIARMGQTVNRWLRAQDRALAGETVEPRA